MGGAVERKELGIQKSGEKGTHLNSFHMKTYEIIQK